MAVRPWCDLFMSGPTSRRGSLEVPDGLIDVFVVVSGSFNIAATVVSEEGVRA